MSFKYRLEARTPQRFGGGTLRTVTRKHIPSLKDMALYSESIDPGSLREVIAASFGLKERSFETLPKRRDIFMAVKREPSDV
jgi:hypothetical protein